MEKIHQSSLSIHHLEEDKKKNLYNTIYSLLNDGGIFINADQMLSPDKEIEELFIRLWKEDILNSGLELEEAEKAFERMKLDKPSKLSDQLQWLKNAGFIKSDCLYKYRNFCTIYGKK